MLPSSSWLYHPEHSLLVFQQKEQIHQHEIQKKAQIDNTAEVLKGQDYAFKIGTLAILCGAATSMTGEPIAGGFIGGGGVIGLVGVFIWGRKTKPKQ